MNRSIIASIGMSAVLALAGCASYDGHNLVAGVSTAADVAATMGVPADKLAALTKEAGELLTALASSTRKPRGRVKPSRRR